MINVVVEGESDRAAVTSIATTAGHLVAKVVVSGGAATLDSRIPKYHAAARQMPWVVFRDSDGQCPVTLMRRLTASLSVPNPNFVLRIAHSMTEAWLLADAEGFAKYFRVRRALIPSDPEGLKHAKQSLLQICTASSSRALRRDVVTSDGQTGPLYVRQINEFAAGHWDVAAASRNSPSLARAIQAIRGLP